MLFNTEWLKDYVEIDIEPKELADRLSMIGHEVDSVEMVEGVPVLDVDLTPNRSDCMNHIGLAREIAAMLDKELKLPPMGFKTVASEKIEDYLEIEINCPDKVHRFTGIVLRNIKIEPSPEWMQKRLRTVGVRSVNNIVDITNYVLLETGHPMHAYDLDLLAERKLIARQAKRGEKVQTLDGEERKLENGDLVITDAERIVGLGGVMGGANTEISDSTKDIALEAAWFDPVSIRKTSKRLGLSTDASYRFERTADVNGPVYAVQRCSNLISEIMSADIVGDMIDQYPAKKDPSTIAFRPERARQLIGVNLINDDIESMFHRLGICNSDRGEYQWKVSVPTFRSDLELEVDLIEEVARLYGYNRVDHSLPKFEQGARSLTPIQRLDRETKDVLVGFGWWQVITYSFASRTENEIFGFDEGSCLKIKNPIADDMDYMRASILPNLIKAAGMNRNYGARDIRLFEVGHVFKNGKGEPPVEERLHLGAVMAGLDYPLHWSRHGDDVGYFHVKGIIEALPSVKKRENVSFEKANLSFLGEEAASLFVDGQQVGFLGRLSDDVAAEFNIEFPLYLAQVDLSALEKIPEKQFKITQISKYQPVERDISFTVDENVSFSDLISFVKSLKIKLLKEIEIFDLYQGDKIPEGKKSLALKLIYLSGEGSLTGEEVNELQTRIIKGLQKNFKAELHR